jgi:hypothetical protein
VAARAFLPGRSAQPDLSSLLIAKFLFFAKRILEKPECPVVPQFE